MKMRFSACFRGLEHIAALANVVQAYISLKDRANREERRIWILIPLCNRGLVDTVIQ